MLHLSKTKILSRLGLIFILSLSIVACNNTSTSTTNNDSSLATSTESVSQVNRVIALTSLSADIIDRLDSTKLVGVAGSRLLKADPRFQDLPVVSEGRSQPDLEKIVALKPDLVIGADGFSDATLTKLEEFGVKTISTKIDSWSGLQENIQTLAEAIDANPEPLIQEYQSLIPEDIESEHSTLVLVSQQPILAPNKDSWTGDLLTQFKTTNVVGDLQSNSQFGGYVTLSPEKVLETNPDVIIIVDPANEGILEELKNQSFWGNLDAVKNDRIYAFDYYGLVNPGSTEKIKTTLAQLSDINKQQ